MPLLHGPAGEERFVGHMSILTGVLLMPEAWHIVGSLAELGCTGIHGIFYQTLCIHLHGSHLFHNIRSGRCGIVFVRGVCRVAR